MHFPALTNPTAVSRMAGVAITTLLASSLAAQWQTSPFSGGTNNRIRYVTGDRLDNLMIVGSFTQAGGSSNHYMAQWNGTSWSQFSGSSLSLVYAFTKLPNGDFLAGNAASVYRSIGGGTWTQMGTYSGGTPLFSQYVNAVTGLPNGDVIVGGAVSSPVSGSGTLRPALVIYPGGTGQPTTAANIVSSYGQTVWCLEPLSATTVAVGGTFSFAGSPTTSLARLTGNVLTPFSSVANPAGTPHLIRALSNGDVLVVFQTSNYSLQRFTGTAAGGVWTQIAAPDGLISDIRELPDGDILFAGSFSTIGGISAPGLARLSGGTTWSALATTVTGGVEGITVLEDDSIVAVGTMTDIDGHAVGNIGRLPIPNLASAAPFGYGCTGPGGTNVLNAGNLPYLGRRCHASATGIDPTAIGLLIFSVTSPGIPLPLPGGPGCMLYADQELLVVSMPTTGGIVDASFSVPNDPAWIGSVMFEQVAGIAADLSLITTTNGLALVFGDI